MSQTSRDMALQRIEDGLVRLGRAVAQLPRQSADKVSRETHEALLAAHDLLRTRAEAAVQGIDRLIHKGGTG